MTADKEWPQTGERLVHRFRKKGGEVVAEVVSVDHKLNPTQQDRESFAMVMRGEQPPQTTQIGKAWACFRKALRDGDSEGNGINLQTLKTCITHYLDMVSIKLEQNDSPNRIFESLNNTGTRLSVSDLIRNYLFMNILDEAEQQEAYKQYWYPMQESLKDRTEDHLSDFFWRFLMMDGQMPRRDETFDGVKKLLGDLTPAETLGVNALAVHAEWLDTVGNLTLSGYNPDLGNRPFSEKKQLLAESNFALSEGLQGYELWNEETIRDRAKALAERAVVIWSQ